MTILVLENLSVVLLLVRNLRVLLARWTGMLDRLVSARAARQVPEWQMREVENEIKRHRRSRSYR